MFHHFLDANFSIRKSSTLSLLSAVFLLSTTAAGFNLKMNLGHETSIKNKMYVDDSIGSILTAKRPSIKSETVGKENLVSPHNFGICWDKLFQIEKSNVSDDQRGFYSSNRRSRGMSKDLYMLSNQTLVHLAYECEDVLFPNETKYVLEQKKCNFSIKVCEDYEGLKYQHKTKDDDFQASSVATSRTSVISEESSLYIEHPPLHISNFILDIFQMHPILLDYGEEENDEVGAHCVIALQFVFVMMESLIRKLTRPNDRPGKSILLKDMIELLPSINIDDECQLNHNLLVLVALMRTLLLPKGINLRNLIWHGFLASLPRRWLALCVIIFHNLTDLNAVTSSMCLSYHKKKMKNSYETLRNIATTKLLVDHGRYLYENRVKIYADKIDDEVESLIPATHRPIMQLAFELYSDMPACFSAIVSPILEHSLRLLWCRHNNRLEDSFAQQDKYYVTLDGHGQRDKHNMVLKPFISLSELQNDFNLIIEDSVLGGSSVALLTDLYASSGSGPNIRAAISHGQWDVHILKELENGYVPMPDIVDESISRCLQSPLEDIMFILLATLHLLESRVSHYCPAFPSSVETSYRPTFSYYATVCRHLDSLISDLQRLWNRLDEFEISSSHDELMDSFAGMMVAPSRLKSMKEALLGETFSGFTSWTADNVREEYSYNVKLSSCGVSRMLILEIAEGVAELLRFFDSYERKLYLNQTTKRGLKQYVHVSSFLYTILGVYSFSSFIALLHIQSKFEESPAIITKKNDGWTPITLMDIRTVERARMCVSTFSTYLIKNSDRALKAANAFAQSKGTKFLLQQLNHSKDSNLVRRKTC